jgi:hypothetical protein
MRLLKSYIPGSRATKKAWALAPKPENIRSAVCGLPYAKSSNSVVILSPLLRGGCVSRDEYSSG